MTKDDELIEAINRTLLRHKKGGDKIDPLRIAANLSKEFGRPLVEVEDLVIETGKKGGYSFQTRP